MIIFNNNQDKYKSDRELLKKVMNNHLFIRIKYKDHRFENLDWEKCLCYIVSCKSNMGLLAIEYYTIRFVDGYDFESGELLLSDCVEVQFPGELMIAWPKNTFTEDEIIDAYENGETL